jgi:aromatic-L-amino-acid decarboxylase
MSKNDTLDYSLESFEKLLQKGCDMVIDRYANLDNAPTFCGSSPDEIKTWFKEGIPTEAMDANELLDIVKHKVMDTATMNIGPHFYAYVNTGGTQISIIAELLATAINQNGGKWHLAPAIVELEKQVVSWSAEMIGFGSDAGGVLLSGGSAANLAGLTVARNIFFEKQNIRNKGLFGLAPFIVYASEEVHGCVDKSVELLGIGMDNFRKVACDDKFKIDVAKLEQQINKDIEAGFTPFCVIGNAGTVNSGAVDPFDKLAGIAEKYGLWFHIDGAYGGLAGALNENKLLFSGIEKADSIAIDFHKWFYQPFEVGCVLVKGWDKLKNTYYKTASYLSTDSKTDNRFDFNEYNFQLSRNSKALKVWMTFKAYGSENIKRAIKNDIDLSSYLEEKICAADDFELCSPSSLSICCFRYVGSIESNAENASLIDQLNIDIIPALESDARVFITGTTLASRPVIRACMINHRKREEHIDFLINVLREVGITIEKN